MKTTKLLFALLSLIFLSACGRTIKGNLNVSENFKIETIKNGSINILEGEYAAAVTVKKKKNTLKVRTQLTSEYGELKFDFLLPIDSYDENTESFTLIDYPEQGQQLTVAIDTEVETSELRRELEACWIDIPVERCYDGYGGFYCHIDSHRQSGRQSVKYYLETITDFINTKITRKVLDLYDVNIAEFNANEVSTKKVYTYKGLCRIL